MVRLLVMLCLIGTDECHLEPVPGDVPTMMCAIQGQQQAQGLLDLFPKYEMRSWRCVKPTEEKPT